MIYTIRNDGIKFKELDFTAADIVHHAPEDIHISDIIGFNSSNLAMEAWWQTPDASFIEIDDAPEGNAPDICLWTGGAGSSLVLSPKANRLLVDTLRPYGEFLPVNVENERYYIFNCFELGQVEENKVEYEVIDGEAFGLKSIEFKTSESDKVVLKSTVDNCNTLYCNEKFKNAVQEFCLTGVVFDKNLVERFE